MKLDIFGWFKTDRKDSNPIEVSLSGVGSFEKYSPTWLYIKNILEQELADLRIKNDRLTLSAEQTFTIRGQIKMCKRLLEIEKVPGNRHVAPADDAGEGRAI